MQTTTAIKVTGNQRQFRRGIDYCKRIGGQFDPEHKLWVLPATVTAGGALYNQATSFGEAIEVEAEWDEDGDLIEVTL